MISRSDTYSPMTPRSRMQPVARFAWLTLSYHVAVIVWLLGRPAAGWKAEVVRVVLNPSARQHTIPSVISNRIYTFPKYAAFPARYPELERRKVVSRFSVSGL